MAYQTTSHALLDCPSYRPERIAPFITLRRVRAPTYLHIGSSDWPPPKTLFWLQTEENHLVNASQQHHPQACSDPTKTFNQDKKCLTNCVNWDIQTRAIRRLEAIIASAEKINLSVPTRRRSASLPLVASDFYISTLRFYLHLSPDHTGGGCRALMTLFFLCFLNMCASQ